MANELVNKYSETVGNKLRQLNANDKQLQSLRRKIQLGRGTQTDVAKFADRLGSNLETTLKDVLHLETLPDAKLTNEFADAVVKPAMKNTLDDVNARAITQMRFSDKRSGINVGIRPANSVDRIDDVTSKMVAADSQEKLDAVISEDVKTSTRKYYDDFQKTNAEIREELGYDQVVIRTYDDVGLHHGTKYAQPCQWCLDRAGTWDYAEARDNGVFNRHPGCNCKIEVITSENTRDTQTNWHHNEWQMG